MDWLKDKKNQPIVIGLFAVILVAVGVFLYMQMAGGGSADSSVSTDSSASTTPSQPTPTPTTTSASAPATTNAAQPAAAGAQVAGIQPLESWRKDPFEPIGYKRPVRMRKAPAPIYDLPIPDMPRWVPNPPEKKEYTENPQPIRRMAGLLLNGRVYAIIETNGTTETVQPGDMLNDRLARVDRIERDKVILKTTDRKPRYITVRMTGAAHQDSGTGVSTGVTPTMPSPGGTNRYPNPAGPNRPRRG